MYVPLPTHQVILIRIITLMLPSQILKRTPTRVKRRAILQEREQGGREKEGEHDSKEMQTGRKATTEVRVTSTITTLPTTNAVTPSKIPPTHVSLNNTPNVNKGGLGERALGKSSGCKGSDGNNVDSSSRSGENSSSSCPPLASPWSLSSPWKIYISDIRNTNLQNRLRERKMNIRRRDTCESLIDNEATYVHRDNTTPELKVNKPVVPKLKLNYDRLLLSSNIGEDQTNQSNIKYNIHNPKGSKAKESDFSSAPLLTSRGGDIQLLTHRDERRLLSGLMKRFDKIKKPPRTGVKEGLDRTGEKEKFNEAEGKSGKKGQATADEKGRRGKSRREDKKESMEGRKSQSRGGEREEEKMYIYNAEDTPLPSFHSSDNCKYSNNNILKPDTAKGGDSVSFIPYTYISNQNNIYLSSERSNVGIYKQTPRGGREKKKNMYSTEGGGINCGGRERLEKGLRGENVRGEKEHVNDICTNNFSNERTPRGWDRTEREVFTNNSKLQTPESDYDLFSEDEQDVHPSETQEEIYRSQSVEALFDDCAGLEMEREITGGTPRRRMETGEEKSTSTIISVLKDGVYISHNNKENTFNKKKNMYDFPSTLLNNTKSHTNDNLFPSPKKSNKLSTCNDSNLSLSPRVTDSSVGEYLSYPTLDSLVSTPRKSKDFIGQIHTNSPTNVSSPIRTPRNNISITTRPPKSSTTFISSGFEVGGTPTRAFKLKRERLAREWYSSLNSLVFSSALPPSLELVWNPRLLRTAGQTMMKKRKGGGKEALQTTTAAADDVIPTNNSSSITSSQSVTSRSCIIHLSCKVLDREDRLQATLLHEMCHVAQFLLEGEEKPPHGPGFQKWARIASLLCPECPVTVTHSYALLPPYRYECVRCGECYRRHSKWKGVERYICGREGCKGILSFLGHFTPSGVRTPTRPLTPYNQFVKDNFCLMKSRHPLKDYGEVMRLLGAEWKLKKSVHQFS